MDVDFVAVLGPVVPIFLPCPFTVVHNASVNGFPRNEDMTCEIQLGGKWYSNQQCGLVSGKRSAKVDKKGEVVLVNLLSMYDRNGTLPKTLRSPAIDRLWSGEDFVTCIRSARARTRYEATVDDELFNLYVQLMADGLSQNIATDLCCRDIGEMRSNTSQWRRIPAISKSFIVIEPFGLAVETKLSMMSVGI